MIYDFSITQADIDRELKYGKKIILTDTEITDHLLNEFAKDTHKSISKSIKIIIVNDNGTIRLMSSDSGDFDKYHSVIASAYSLLHEKCSMQICGGGYLKMEKYIRSIDLEISGSSGSFGKMNSDHLFELSATALLKFNVEYDESEMDRSIKFEEFTYEKIHYLSQHIGE